MPPLPLATPFGEPDYLPDDLVAHQNGDSGTLSSQGTVLAPANHQQSQSSILPYSTLPSSETRTPHNFQPLDLRLPSRLPNVFQEDDVTHHDRLRNVKQL